MRLECSASCFDCDWTHADTDMESTSKAADKHGRAQGHSTSWHCQKIKG